MPTTTTNANGIKQQQSERTRATLIEAATELLLDKGYEGTTLALLAHKVRMTKGAIYHHFADKEALLRAVMEHVRRTWEREVGAHIPPAGDALERLGALFDHQARLIDQEPSLCLLVTGLTLQSRSLGRELAAVVEAITADMAELIRGMLADGQRAGTVRTDLDARRHGAIAGDHRQGHQLLAGDGSVAEHLPEEDADDPDAGSLRDPALGHG